MQRREPSVQASSAGDGAEALTFFETDVLGQVLEALMGFEPRRKD